MSGYKRVKPIVCRAGGKTRLLKHLLPLVPETKCYVEVFGGGAALLLAREPRGIEVYNDIDGELVNLFRQAKYHSGELCRELSSMPASRELFAERLQYSGATEIQRAASYLYLNRISFGSKGENYGTMTSSGGASNSSKRNWLTDIQAFSDRFDKVSIERDDWRSLITRYDRPHTFFFFDPPYINSGKTNYAAWKFAEMEEFAKTLRSLKGQWLLTVCDSPECREIFKGWNIRPVSRANGIENRAGRKANPRYKELIITKS